MLWSVYYDGCSYTKTQSVPWDMTSRTRKNAPQLLCKLLVLLALKKWLVKWYFQALKGRSFLVIFLKETEIIFWLSFWASLRENVLTMTVNIKRPALIKRAGNVPAKSPVIGRKCSHRWNSQNIIKKHALCHKITHSWK